jgi:hypothetical protein
MGGRDRLRDQVWPALLNVIPSPCLHLHAGFELSLIHDQFSIQKVASAARTVASI